LLDRKRLRLARDGRDVPPNLYRRSAERDPVDAEKLMAFLNQSASLVINRVQDVSPAVRRVAQQIELRLKQVVNVNAYLTFGASGAFETHYDTHDVLVLQVYGSKRWFIYDQPERSPLAEAKVRGVKPADIKVEYEFDLLAGDVIFVPRGMYHRASVTDQDSVHLTFGIHTTKGIDFVDFLRKEASKDEMLRQDLLSYIGGDLAAIQEQAIKDRLCQLVQSTSFHDLLVKIEDNRDHYDQFRIGPPTVLDQDPLLAPLIRHRRAYEVKRGKVGAGDDRSTLMKRRVIDVLIDRNAVRLSDLCSDFNPEYTAFEIRETVTSLVDDCFVEILNNVD